MTKEQLKTWRTKMKLSQAGLARLLHISTHAVYQWEAGRRQVPAMLETTLPLISHAHAAQYRVTRKTRKAKLA